ncbi:hypothetical protein [Pleurocapsa sp. PCC 7327]|uniref:hypothetical protein n=1 Tax=Pleurocapsa sp. PCC 7327 TaxID=118163 RepID=UPI0002F541A6|nr:hypothetical protein [Pleurocapsa sp. PCC 7327]
MTIGLTASSIVRSLPKIEAAIAFEAASCHRYSKLAPFHQFYDDSQSPQDFGYQLGTRSWLR